MRGVPPATFGEWVNRKLEAVHRARHHGHGKKKRDILRNKTMTDFTAKLMIGARLTVERRYAIMSRKGTGGSPPYTPHVRQS